VLNALNSHRSILQIWPDKSHIQRLVSKLPWNSLYKSQYSSWFRQNWLNVINKSHLVIFQYTRMTKNHFRQKIANPYALCTTGKNPYKKSSDDGILEQTWPITIHDSLYRKLLKNLYKPHDLEPFLRFHSTKLVTVECSQTKPYCSSEIDGRIYGVIMSQTNFSKIKESPIKLISHDSSNYFSCQHSGTKGQRTTPSTRMEKPQKAMTS
jgi:hypothetical protein